MTNGQVGDGSGAGGGAATSGSKTSGFQKGVLAAFLVTALAAVAYFLLWPDADVDSGEDLPDARTALIRDLAQDPADTLLFVNLPPAAGRYPGSILLVDRNVGLEFVDADDAGLMQGQAVTSDRRIKVTSSAELGLGLGGSQGPLAAAMDALFQRRDEVEVRVSFEGTTVEDRTLMERVAASQVARNVTEAGADAYVIVRAWRGTVTLDVQRKRGGSAEVMDTLSATLDSIAASAGAGVRFSGGFESGAQGVLQLSENDVVAYQGYELAPFYRLAANVAPEDPVAGGESGIRPAVPRPDATPEDAVRQYMRLDPELLRPEDRERTFRQLGPGAAAAVTSVMEDGDAEEREKGMEILRQLPPSAFSPAAGTGAGGAGNLGSALDAALRARAILDMSAADPAQRDSLGSALRDPSPAIRYLASEQLEAAGTADARETLLTRAAADDPAVRTAVSAARFEVARLQDAITPAAAFESSDAALALGSVHATRSLSTDARTKLDIFVRGLASDDPAVVKESLAGLVEMGAAARPAIPAVEELLATTRDRTIEDMARRALARMRAA